MSYGHALAFGVRITPTPDPAGPVGLARLAEELGYDVVTVPDRPDDPGLDAGTLLSWIAGVTSTIRLTADGHDLPLREPALLARSVATLDHLAGGRVELGFALAAPAAAAGMGAPVWSPEEAVEALGEALDVVRELWNVLDRGLARTGGRFYRVSGARKGAPAHDVPITITGVEPALLELAGRRADGWSLPHRDLARDLAALPEGNERVDAAARAAGRDPREIRRRITVRGGFGERDGALTGVPAEWVEDLLPLVVEHGVDTIVLDSDDPAVLTRFAGEVVPALRAAVEAALPGGAAGPPVRRSSVLARRRAAIDYDDVPQGIAEVIEPGDLAYARFHSGYLRGGAPGIVLRAATAQQASDALAFARRHPDLPLSRRSAGHGISGRSTNNGGIVIDVSLMNTIEVLDAETRRVRIGPGARWKEVAAALAPYGWALSSGDYGGVGVGGLATAGGIGYLAREHGLTIDHLRAVEMVLADGSIVRASDVDNPDLFWAVRGAGANFGIVTAFEFEVDEVGLVAYAELTQDASDTARYLEDWATAVENSPRDVTSFLIVPPPRRGQPSIALSRTVVDSEDADTVLSRLQPFAEIAPMYAQQAQILPYAAVMANATDDEPMSSGEPVSRSGLLDHVTPAFAKAAARVIRSGAIHWFQLRAVGGAVADVDPDATAYANRAANFSVVVMGSRDDDVDQVWELLRPFLDGMYLSFDSSLRPERIAEAWPPRALARLRALKAEYDPDVVFGDNFTLTPTPTSEKSTR